MNMNRKQKEETKKTCLTCKKEKTVSQFYKRGDMTNSNNCKDCDKERVKAYKKRNIPPKDDPYAFI